nr:sporulation protein YqfD [Bacillus halotolerans]
MKNKWLSFFGGKVQLEVTGRGIERLLNECTRRGIPIFHLKKKKEAVLLYIQLQDVHAFRRVRREFDCKARFINRKGFPFLLLKSKLNLGFTIGFALFLSYCFCSPIWYGKLK